jgi:hypothetical protein
MRNTERVDPELGCETIMFTLFQDVVSLIKNYL